MKGLFQNLSSLLGELEEFLVVKINTKIYLSRLRPYTITTDYAWRRHEGLYIYPSPTLFRHPPAFGFYYSSRHRAHLLVNSPSRSLFSNPSRLGLGVHLDRAHSAHVCHDWVRAIHQRIRMDRLRLVFAKLTEIQKSLAEIDGSLAEIDGRVA